MKHFSGYGAYLLFLALRTHFTKVKYDFFEMNGKLRANKESYEKRRDKMFFMKLAKLYNAEELKYFFVANFLDDRHYITDMLSEEAHGAYYEFEKRRQSLSYVFKNDIEKLFENGCHSAFKSDDGDYPLLVGMVLSRDVSLDSAVILNDFVPYVSKFDKYMDDDCIWQKISRKIKKYKPFLKYEKDKMKIILKGVIHEQREKTEAFSAKTATHRTPVFYSKDK